MLGLGLTARRALAWWPAAATYAADFVDRRYMRNGVWVDAATAFSLSRASVGWASNVAGPWTQFAVNAARFTTRGLVIEPLRQNSIRNSAMVGAVVGAPGTLPSQWGRFKTGGLNDPAVVAVGQEAGIDYVDIRIWGTATGSNDAGINLDALTTMASNDTYVLSAFARVLSGSLEALTYAQLSCGRHNSGTYVSGSPIVDLRMAYAWQRWGLVDVVPASGVNQIRASFACRVPNTVTVDAVVRLGWPQLEIGAAASSSPIVTSGTVATREADVLTLSLPPGPHNLQFIFDDGIEQMSAGPWSGSAVVPTTLNRSHIRRIYALPV